MCVLWNFRDMSCRQFLILCTVTLWTAAIDENDLPCSARSNITPDVFWPDIDNGTCSTSVPSCLTPDGFLEIRCCVEGKTSEVNCTKSDSVEDPRCLGHMKSTVGNSNVKVCYEFVNQTSFPFKCSSRTGLMMEPNFDLLTSIGGSNTGIWLPIEKYIDTFRYSTVNSFYMDSFGNISSSNSSARCLILLEGNTKEVSCNERHLGICLDFPFIIYQFSVEKLDDLLFQIKDRCLTGESENDNFCWFFKQRYNLNILYFSSRINVDDPYIILQKSNLRFIVQIRKYDIPRSKEIINLHVALTSSDWEIFTNTSFSVLFYETFDENLYLDPKVILSVSNDSTTIKEINPNSIKWTQKEECTHYIFCFFSAAPDYHVEKFEVLENFQLDFKDKNGVFWCEAFDFDLKTFSSNVISIGEQTIFHYISEMTVTIEDIESCDSSLIRSKIIDFFVISKNDKNFYFDIRNLSVLECEVRKTAKMNISIYWFPKHSAYSLDSIEQEYSKLIIVIDNISKNCIGSNLNISSLHYVRHSDYCLRETTVIGNLPFYWQTTPNGSQITSFPFCYYRTYNMTLIAHRYCNRNTTGSTWSPTMQNCEPTSNVTQLLEIYSSEKFGQNGILQNLNVIIEKHHEKFHVNHVYLLSKIVTQLKEITTNIDKGLENLSLLVNNLHFIKKDVLKVSQNIYQTTDSIMNSSDYMYTSSEGGQNLTEKNHCYYTLNFTEHPKATGVVLKSSGESRQIKLLESVDNPVELTTEDGLEAAVFLDSAFLKHANITTVKFSIFFDNYLFDNNHLSATNRTIFKVMPPDENKLKSFTSFLTMKSQTKEEICSCWKYGNIRNDVPESKWYRTSKFNIDSHPFCIIESVAYCTIFSAELEDTNGYISKFSIEFPDWEKKNISLNHSIPTALIKILDEMQYLLLDEVTYEFDYKTNIVGRKREFLVAWRSQEPSESIADLEKGYNNLKRAIEMSAQYFLNHEFVDWMGIEYLRHKKYCLNDIYVSENLTIIFKATPLNKTTISLPPCYTSNGILQRRCIGNYTIGSYWEQLSNQPFVGCSSNVTNIFEYILKNFPATEPNKVLNDLANMTAISSQDFNPIDIFLVSEILLLISSSNGTIEIQSLSALTSNIQKTPKDVLRDAQLQYNATDQILYSLDRILLNSVITQNKENNFYTVELRNINESDGLILQRDGNDYDVSIVNGSFNEVEALEGYNNFESAIFFNGFNRSESIIVSIFFEDVLFVDTTWTRGVSVIFGILLPDNHQTPQILGEIELVFKNDEGADKACAFWRYGMDNGAKIRGKWKNESQPNENFKFSSCKFNHTTHFAMLIDDGSSDPKYLNIVTNIGCFLSTIGFLGILITGLIFERWRKNLGNIILMNFVFTVIIQIFLFYFSGFIHSLISRSNFCILVGSLLHYSVISEFCWMLIVAILQFKRFVKVLTGPPKCVLLKSFLIGWGIPLIPVLSVLLIDSSNYTYSRTGLCYPSNLGLYLGVWLPIFVITMINFIIFSYIMYSICNRKTECVDTVSNEIVFQCRLAVLLFFMLGLTWSFAFIGEYMMKEIFLYLFCVTSTLQGFIMFLFFIVFNERTRLLYSSLLRKI